MTQNYLAGETSLLLQRLQAVAGDRAHAAEAARLGRAAETVPIPDLPYLLERALPLADELCWASLASGDAAAFAAQSAASHALGEFAECADLLE